MSHLNGFSNSRRNLLFFSSGVSINDEDDEEGKEEEEADEGDDDVDAEGGSLNEILVPSLLLIANPINCLYLLI